MDSNKRIHLIVDIAKLMITILVVLRSGHGHCIRNKF